MVGAGSPPTSRRMASAIMPRQVSGGNMQVRMTIRAFNHSTCRRVLSRANDRWLAYQSAAIAAKTRI